MTTRWGAVAVLIIILAWWMIPTMAQDDDGCTVEDLCFQLFEDNRGILEIQRIRPIRSGSQFFRNPMLRAEISLSGSFDTETRVRVQMRQPLELAGRENQCDLLILGLSDQEGANPEALQTEVEIQLSSGGDGTFVGDVDLHAFCQDNNLPVTTDQIDINRPPPGEAVFEVGGDPLQTDALIPTREEFITPLAQRLATGACPTEPDNPTSALTPANIAAQFAVFMIYANDDGGMDVEDARDGWGVFHEVEANRVYVRDYAGIHCLLGIETEPLTADLTCDPACDEALVAPQQLTFTAVTTGDLLSRTLTISDSSGQPIVPDAVQPDEDENAITYTLANPGTYTAMLTVEGVGVAYTDNEVQVRDTVATQTLTLQVTAPAVGVAPPPPVLVTPFGAFNRVNAIALGVGLLAGSVLTLTILGTLFQMQRRGALIAIVVLLLLFGAAYYAVTNGWVAWPVGALGGGS